MLAGFFVSYNFTSHAGAVAKMKDGDLAEFTSLIPLVLFVVAGVFVYLCNRPRKVVVYARARRGSETTRRTLNR